MEDDRLPSRALPSTGLGAVQEHGEAATRLREAHPALFAHPQIRDRLFMEGYCFGLVESGHWPETLETAQASAARLMALLW